MREKRSVIILTATNHTNYGRKTYEEVKGNDNVNVQKVTKAADIEKMKNNPRLYTVCQNEKEIVYRKENVKLCRECLDNIKHQDER